MLDASRFTAPPAPAKAPSFFDVAVEDRDEAAWVIARGELDIASGVALDDALLAAASAAAVVLDLRDVTFCDSSGLAILLRARRQLPSLTIHPSSAVERVAEIAGVFDLLLGE